MVIGLLSAVFLTGAWAATDAFGNTLYKSQLGAPEGHPGVFPGTREVEDKATGEKKEVPLYPRWGFPE